MAAAPDDDIRWLVVDGRRWRRSDPAIPAALRAELVAELMRARRAIAAAGRAGDDALVAAERRHVAAAKVALGERGEPWWDPPTPAGRRARLAAAIRALAHHRAPDRTTCPSDAARAVGGAGWREAMDDTRAVARELAQAGEVELLQRGAPLDPTQPWRGPIRIRSGGSSRS